MPASVLVIGKNGQVGTDLRHSFPANLPIHFIGRNEINLADPNSIRKGIRNYNPRLIINAAAYTAVDKAESDQATAHAVNTEAPGILADEAKKIGAALIHYSTDYVFDGTKNSPYVEEDPTNPVSVYGKTKLEGEKAIQAAGIPYLIFRTEWVYATRGKNFLLTILRLAAEREELRIVADQTGAPTSSRAIASATTEVVMRELKDSSSNDLFASRRGIYNMTAAGETTWHGFATAIVDEAHRATPAPPWMASATANRPLIVKQVKPIATAEYPTPARRPAYSILSNERLAQTFGVRLPDWRTQLSAAFAEQPPG
jgi:dTDP-4-dehydrorhamnose reductase